VEEVPTMAKADEAWMVMALVPVGMDFYVVHTYRKEMG